MPIHPLLRAVAFEPSDIQAMSRLSMMRAKPSKCPSQTIGAREVIATRIIDLAEHGEHSPTRLLIGC
jgi:hypothetical protein